jgi:hypothetical protein
MVLVRKNESALVSQSDVGASALEFILVHLMSCSSSARPMHSLRKRDFGALRLKSAVGKMWKSWGRAW